MQGTLNRGQSEKECNITTHNHGLLLFILTYIVANEHAYIVGWYTSQFQVKCDRKKKSSKWAQTQDLCTLKCRVWASQATGLGHDLLSPIALMCQSQVLSCMQPLNYTCTTHSWPRQKVDGRQRDTTGIDSYCGWNCTLHLRTRVQTLFVLLLLPSRSPWPVMPHHTPVSNEKRTICTWSAKGFYCLGCDTIQRLCSCPKTLHCKSWNPTH